MTRTDWAGRDGECRQPIVKRIVTGIKKEDLFGLHFLVPGTRLEPALL
jgi:hypothetical protein